ncbi:MAG: hypothetical protein IMZ57_04125 [Acidobacteria bacterium]|nr:hypothetical protein [Acidobacteriota bacterium]
MAARKAAFDSIQAQRRVSGRATPPPIPLTPGTTPQDVAVAGQTAASRDDAGDLLRNTQAFGGAAVDAAAAKIAYDKAGGVEGELSRMTPRQRSEAEARGRANKRFQRELPMMFTSAGGAMTTEEKDAYKESVRSSWGTSGKTFTEADLDATTEQADIARTRQKAQQEQLAVGADLRAVDNARLGATVNAPKAPTVPGKKSVIKLSDGSNGVYNERDGTVERLNEGPPMSPDAAKALRIASRARRGESNVVSTVVGDRIVTKKYDDAGQEIGIDVKDIGPDSSKPITMHNIKNSKGEAVDVLVDTDRNGVPKRNEDGTVKMLEFQAAPPPVSDKPRSLGKGSFNGEQGEWWKTGNGPATFAPLPDGGSFGTKPDETVDPRILPETYKKDDKGNFIIVDEKYVMDKPKRYGLVVTNHKTKTFRIEEMDGVPDETNTVPGNGGASTTAPVAPPAPANADPQEIGAFIKANPGATDDEVDAYFRKQNKVVR